MDVKEKEMLILDLIDSENYMSRLKEKIRMLLDDNNIDKYPVYFIRLKNEENRYYSLLEELRSYAEYNNKIIK